MSTSSSLRRRHPPSLVAGSTVPRPKGITPLRTKKRSNGDYLRETVNSGMNVLSQPAARPYIGLLLVSFAIRYWRISEPAAVVFDEYHFGRFVNNYLTGHYLFDIHPPLGKLTMAGFAYIMGYDPNVCSYANIDDDFHPDCKYYLLRYFAAFWGAFLPLQVHGIARLMGLSAKASMLAACLVLLDFLNLIESRLVLTDSQLMFHCANTFLVGMMYWHRMGRKDLPPLTNKAKNYWLIAIGFCCGCAVSVKWTALAYPGMMAIESVFGIFGMVPQRFGVMDVLKVTGVVVFLYALVFNIHFSSLPLSGDGDEFMSYEFRQTLEGSDVYDPAAQPIPFWSIMPELNREMLAANARIETPHDWSSRWPQWMLNIKGVLYWSRTIDNNSALIYLNGNPIVIWTVLAGVIMAAFTMLQGLSNYLPSPTDAPPARKAKAGRNKSNNNKHKRKSSDLDTDSENNYAESDSDDVRTDTSSARRAFADTIQLGKSTVTSRMMFLLCSFLANLLPYLAVKRAAFAYHYMPACLLGFLITGLYIDRFCPIAHRDTICNLISIASVACFFYYAPWVYGFPLSAEGHESRRWLSTWT